MLKSDYLEYLQSFNDMDYDRVLSFWAPEFTVLLQGEVLFDGPESLKRTYSFLHQHVKEEIIIEHYLSDQDRVFMEAIVRISAVKTMTAEAIAEQGLSGVMPIEAGQAYDIPQFIHYHLQDGKFKTGICLISGPVRPVS